MNATLTVRLDEQLKADFNAVARSVGLDAPTVVRMLIVQTVRDQAIPLSLAVPDCGERETMAFLNEARPDWDD